MTDLLVMEDVACWRGGRMLFEGLQLRLAPGEAAWVQGPNGSGKSSLLRLAAGLLRPAAGIIRAGTAGLAGDGLGLDREQTLSKALGFWAALDASSEALDAALQAFGLERLAEVPVRLLSTGQARRAGLARVLASGAGLWLLDEPLTGLDEASVGQLEQVMAAHRRSGGAILAASHLPLPGRAWRTLELGR